VFVFPRRFVTIQHEGGVPFVAGTNEITFYKDWSLRTISRATGSPYD
jgi:hypothetical protein